MLRIGCEIGHLMDIFRIAMLCVGEISLHTALLAVEPFRAANRLGPGKPFEIDFVGLTGGVLHSMIGLPLATRAVAEIGSNANLALILACYDTESSEKPRLFSWLRALRKRGAQIAGIDYAPLLLAEAGLLTNRRATAHWSALAAFSERHADIRVEDALYVIDGDIATCAGQIATLDFSLALLKPHVSAEMFQAVQDELVYRARDRGDQPQRPSRIETQRRGDPALTKAIALMEAHIEYPLPVTQIARQVGLSERELQRRFRGHICQGPTLYYRDIRLNRAFNLLQYSALSVREVGLATGFADHSTFYRAFRSRFHQSPQNLRAGFRAASATPHGRQIGFTT